MSLIDDTKKALGVDAVPHTAPPDSTVYWPMPGKAIPSGVKGTGKAGKGTKSKGSRGGRKSPFPKWTGWK